MQNEVVLESFKRVLVGGLIEGPDLDQLKSSGTKLRPEKNQGINNSPPISLGV